MINIRDYLPWSLMDSSNIHRLLMNIKPDEVYNLGAQSHMALSLEVPEHIVDIDGLGAIRLLDAVRDLGPKCKYFQASSSEMFVEFLKLSHKMKQQPFIPILLMVHQKHLLTG